MATRSTIKIRLGGLKELARKHRGSPEFRGGLRNIAKRYEVFVSRRFKRESEGGGDWAPHAASTKAARTKGKRKDGARIRSRTSGSRKRASQKILIDNGILFASLKIGDSGNYLKVKKQSVLYGFGTTIHPGAQINMRQLAIIHDRGLGNVPARPILVVPDETTKQSMMAVLKRTEQQILRRCAAKARMR